MVGIKSDRNASADPCNVRVIYKPIGTSQSDVECKGWMYYRGVAPVFLVIVVFVSITVSITVCDYYALWVSRLVSRFVSITLASNLFLNIRK
jgi:hypothetical protein